MPRKPAPFERFGSASGALAPVADDEDDVPEATTNGHSLAPAAFVFDAAFVDVEAPAVAEGAAAHSSAAPSSAMTSSDDFETPALAAFDIDGSSLDAAPASEEREADASAAVVSAEAAGKSPASSGGVKRAFEARCDELARTDTRARTHAGRRR